MPYIGKKISINKDSVFNSLKEARQSAQKNEGTEAIIKIKGDKSSTYELRQIFADDQKEIHYANELRGNVKFYDLGLNETIAGFSLAESPDTKENDLFIPFVDRTNCDTQDKQAYSSILTATSNSHGINEAERREQMINNLIKPLQSPEVQKELKKFLLSINPKELLTPEQQGLKWKNGSSGGIVGQSTGGHHVNSVMSSIQYLIRRNRLRSGGRLGGNWLQKKLW